MKLIKSLALAILLSAPAAMQAMDFPWITFTLSDQSELSVDAEGLEMTYSDGSLHLHSSRVDKTLATSSIVSMRFSSTNTGVDEIENPLTSEAEYFTLSGESAGIFKSADEAHTALPSGIYIAKSATKTIKVIF